MKIFKKKIFLLSLVVLLGVSTFWFSPAARSVESSWSIFYEVMDVILRDYVEKDVDLTKLIYGAIRGMLASLDDPYTRFMEPKAFNETKIHMKGQFYGVGIQIGIKNNHLTVISPIEGTPAYKAGIQSLDMIIAIDGSKTEGISLEEAVTKIRGDKGSEVVLTVYRKSVDKKMDIAILRDAIKLKSVSKKKILNEKVGYIQLVTFESKEATREMELAISELKEKGMQAVVIDLRNNGGGLLRNAIQIASIFIEEGTVVKTVDRDGREDVISVIPGRVACGLPLIILINEASASASEILAGAVKDNKRGTIVGMHSFGKASVQNIKPLADGSAVLVTIAKYLTPNGTDINKKGISPNIEVQFTTENIKVMTAPDYIYNEKDDVQLQKAVGMLLDELNDK